MFSVLARLCCCSCWSGRPGGRRGWCWCVDKVPHQLSVQVLEAIHRERILVQKKRQGRGFRGVFGKVQTYTTYVFSISTICRCRGWVWRHSGAWPPRRPRRSSRYHCILDPSCYRVSAGCPGDTEGGDQVPGVPAEERRREESCQQAHGVRGQILSKYQYTGFEFVEINYLNLTYPTYINLLF